MKETEKENTFEEALQKLERAVEKLDEGSLSLEEALSTFEAESAGAENVISFWKKQKNVWGLY